LQYTQDQISFNGWAIEARILAEDASADFMPMTGQIAYLGVPGGPGVRFDSALYAGMPITADYDSLIAKVIAHGEDRQAALCRLRRALSETQISGVSTDIDFLTQVIDSDIFTVGRATTTYLDIFQPSAPDGEDPLNQEVAVVAALLAHGQQAQTAATNPAETNGSASHWREAAWREQMRGG
jgi:acetyl/propionyl-CoA carboxylase alpha subunit